ncbi:SHOCT domain-containing protein [Nocardioides stalactiti]|uniref:SHOCT domain-containing protein n=1 Tax=Nocardioides stalactiti TaxID=2755356 RepID=UPI0016012A65|nr:SHOCT domain-containing protein [Nocardioides stalactiti]
MSSPAGRPEERPEGRAEERPPSFLRNLATTLPFVLLCGIVGPIFLFFYFALGSFQEEVGWMLWTGLGVTILDVVLGFGIAAARTRSQHRTYRLRRTGKRGYAEIVNLEQTGIRINDEPLLSVHVRISGEDLATFEAQSQTVIADFRLPLLYSGPMPVLVDPESLEWEFDWDAARPGIATAPLVAAFAPPVAGDPRPRAERLAELDDLLQKDLIAREEYDATRARILGEI